MAASSGPSSPLRRVGYVFDERFLWHETWSIQYSPLVQPFRHWESPETKRRFHSLLAVSGLLSKLHVLPSVSPATREQIQRMHTAEYVSRIERVSQRDEGGNAGEEAPFSKFAFGIASLSAGGVIAAADAVMEGTVNATYALTRPPGHHAEPDRGMGFCLFNNVAIAAHHVLETYRERVKRIAIVDYDVHHGNGTQRAFYEDDRVLLVSLHQANNYPANSGTIAERGGGNGDGLNVNVPLPPGSGFGAYEYAFQRVVNPALRAFKPNLIFVSSGFDASYADPLAAMILSSRAFRFFARELMDAAHELCGGKIVFCHEGGYSETYVPFCGAAVVEEMLGIHDPRCQIEDPFLAEAERWEYQELQTHQREVIDRVAHAFPSLTA